MASRSRKARRTQLWLGHVLITGTIYLGVTAVNHTCTHSAGWPTMPGDGIRVAFCVAMALAIAVSFSGKGPEGHA